MDGTRQWIAILDEDEDDFIFWQYGFQQWAEPIELKWFVSAEQFLIEMAHSEKKPACILLDGIVPYGEEMIWLRMFSSHICCQNVPVLILAGQLREEDEQNFMDQGATDYLLKPTNADELQTFVQKIMNQTNYFG